MINSKNSYTMIYALEITILILKNFNFNHKIKNKFISSNTIHLNLRFFCNITKIIKIMIEVFQLLNVIILIKKI